jgi:hypothetical protein
MVCRAAAAPLAVAVVVGSLMLGGCGTGDGLGLARQACGHVDTSLRLYERSLHEGSPRGDADRLRATEQLQDALQLAAQANSADPQYNPLMTTLQEIGRIDEGHLVVALRASCNLANSANPQPPVITSTVPGQTSVPTPSTLPGQ